MNDSAHLPSVKARAYLYHNPVLMIVLSVLFFIVVGIICYIFFAPFYLEINSLAGKAEIRFHYLAAISLRYVDPLFLEVRIVWWKKRITLFSSGAEEKKLVQKKPGRIKRRIKIHPRKMWAVIRSFKVNRCRIIVDTGDSQLNGILFPVFYLAAFYSRKNICINFIGENEIVLEIQNTLARMSWAYLSS